MPVIPRNQIPIVFSNIVTNSGFTAKTKMVIKTSEKDANVVAAIDLTFFEIKKKLEPKKIRVIGVRD